jgi:hypothetical protein
MIMVAKRRIGDQSMVLIVLSINFLAMKACLCHAEMTWMSYEGQESTAYQGNHVHSS